LFILKEASCSFGVRCDQSHEMRHTNVSTLEVIGVSYPGIKSPGPPDCHNNL